MIMRGKAGIIFLFLVATIGAGAFGLHSCQRAGWERSLMGPYSGREYTGELTNEPVSIISIPLHGRLEVYEPASENAPVLAMRSEAGAIQWSRLLLPERKTGNGQVQQAWVRSLRLEKLDQNRNGCEVLLTCDWEWGGKERGLIDLDSHFEFKSFRLSW